MNTKNVTLKLVLILGLTLTSSGHAWAADASDDPITYAKARFDVELTKIADWTAENGGSHSPEYDKTGIGLGGGLGSTSSEGMAGNLSAAFSSRIFKEGSDGKVDYNKNNDYYRPDAMRSELYQHFYDAENRKLGWRYNESNPDNKRGTMTEAQVQRAKERDSNDDEAAYNAGIADKLRDYEAAYGRMNEVSLQHPDARPLYLFEGSAAYNMVGKSKNGGAFTGLSGNLRGGIGFTFKDYGKNGCDIYFLGTANASASGFYKLDDANSARVAVGVEQGILCQIANTVTIMASPSVQAGKFAHSNPQDDSTATTDWLNYSARFRAIVDGRLYLAAETVLHPSMKKAAAPGSHWEASESSLSLDYALAHSPWVVGADLKHVEFHDDNSAVTGMKNITDNSLLFRAIRAF